MIIFQKHSIFYIFQISLSQNIPPFLKEFTARNFVYFIVKCYRKVQNISWDRDWTDAEIELILNVSLIYFSKSRSCTSKPQAFLWTLHFGKIWTYDKSDTNKNTFQSWSQIPMVFVFCPTGSRLNGCSNRINFERFPNMFFEISVMRV